MTIPDYIFRNLNQTQLTLVFETNDQLHRQDVETTFSSHLYSIMQKTFGNAHYCSGFYQLEPFGILEHEVPTIDAYWRGRVEQHALDHPFVQKLLSSPSTDIDFTRQRSFKKTALYNDVYDHLQAQNQMWICVKGENELLNCIYSRETPYTEEELAMLQLILPHVEQSWKQWKKTNLLKAEIARLSSPAQTEEQLQHAASLRQAINTLSPRQYEVLELLAAGMDNQQIADTLKISIQTVKKHLQAIFQSMDVLHRTELAAKWHQAHSIPRY